MSFAKAELGNLSAVPQPVENPAFENVDMQPDDWLLVSLVDGRQSLADILGASPVSAEQSLEILVKLANGGIIVLPEAEKAVEAQDEVVKLDLPPPPSGWPTPYEAFRAPDLRVAGVDPEYIKRLAYYHAHLGHVDYYQLLGVPRTASARDIKRQFLKLSKIFHPDRFFRKEIGALEDVLGAVFRAVNEAFKVLSKPAMRQSYDQAPPPSAPPPPQEWSRPASVLVSQPAESDAAVPPQATGKRALLELLAKGKQLEKDGHFLEAAMLYREALEQRQSAELMNRIAECLIRLRQDYEVAEAYARRSVELEPQVGRYWVPLAYLMELRQDFSTALQTYEQALTLDPSNQAAKLRRDQVAQKLGVHN